jgi:hypothetical protein
MKAITAIHAVIVIVLGVLTIMAILALFLGSYNPAAQGVNLETARSSACKTVVSLGCDTTMEVRNIVVENFDADVDGKIDPGRVFDWNDPFNANNNDNLASLCYNYYGVDNDADCMVIVCGCRE